MCQKQIKESAFAMSYKSMISIIFLAVFGCNPSEDGTSAVDVAIECVKSDLAGLCPLGTSPRLSSSADSSCEQATDFEAQGSSMDINTSASGSASVDTVCVGTGECLIACDIVVTCENGYKTFTAMMIECN